VSEVKRVTQLTQYVVCGRMHGNIILLDTLQFVSSFTQLFSPLPLTICHWNCWWICKTGNTIEHGATPHKFVV